MFFSIVSTIDFCLISSVLFNLYCFKTTINNPKPKLTSFTVHQKFNQQIEPTINKFDNLTNTQEWIEFNTGFTVRPTINHNQSNINKSDRIENLSTKETIKESKIISLIKPAN